MESPIGICNKFLSKQLREEILHPKIAFLKMFIIMRNCDEPNII